jgi:ElaB/YqjD/DUF883 family membrane-anchored ribosome-binding protein
MDDTTRRMNEPGVSPVAHDTAAAENPDRRAAEIRGEIEHTREEMAETIDAIQDKLRPRNIVANATERVKVATTERVRAMADTASDAAYNVAERTREGAGGFLDSIRENPYPATLVGLGLAWWIASARRRPSPYYVRTGESNRYENRDAFGRYDAMYEEASMRERLGSRAKEYVDEAKEYVSDTSDTLRRSTRRAQGQVQRAMHENTLLVGAGALLLGAAFGMVVPETDVENEWMGEARDSVVERAQEMASDAANKVQETASQVASTAGNIADSVGNRQG